MKPFLRSLSTLSAEPALKEIVFLGSLATPKYTRPLHEALGDRIKVPREFPGMGNLQRGSLLLKAVDAGVPVSLIPLSACL